MFKLNFKAYHYSVKPFFEGKVMNLKKVIFGFCFFLFMPFIVSAADYDITNYAVRAYIEENGDVKVNEIFVLDGDFNGYERDLDDKPYLNDNYETSFLYQGNGIEDIQVQAKYIPSFQESLFTDEDFTSFVKASYASNGDIGKYIETRLGTGYRLRMYYRANHQKVAFFLSYTIKDLVVVHDDVAEIYYPFIGDDFLDDIHNVDIKVFLPNRDETDFFRIWAHGVLSGEVEAMEKEGLHAYAKKVNAKEVLDVRMTFNKNLVPMASKKSNSNYFNKILEIEEKRAEDANNLRKELRAKYDFVVGATITFYVVLIGLWIFVFYKYGKSPKSGYYSKYNREFIDEYNVEVIDYLMNRKITPNAMSASIMNLIYKKNLTANELVEEKKKKKDYEFILENTDNINESEQILIDFLFDKVGKGKLNSENKKTFTTKDLKNYASGTKTCNTFINSYTKWKNHIISIGKEQKFYEKHATPVIFGVILLIVSFVIFSYAMGEGVDFIPTYFIFFVSIIFFIYTILVIKKTQRGAEHYDKWKTFKNFLNDFGSFELKELPEIVLWERYLVYATIFGLADKVQKSMNVRIQELDVTSMDYYPSYVYINMGNSISSSINSAINSAYSRQAANYSNSHSSSSSGGGFGGGFSGGSGFSGGGGGRGF